jgi:AcrR family transcriptional regulator
MPRPRFEKMEPSRRRALLDAAAKEFTTKGFEQASVNVILDEAGFSKSSFYYYFDDKVDLAGTVLEEVYRPLIEAIDIGAAHSVEEFWREVHRQQRASLDAMEASPRTFRLISRTASAVVSDPALQARLMPLIATARDRQRAFWKLGQTLGAVRADVSADQLMAMLEAVKRAAWQTSFPPDHVPTVAEVEAFSRHMLDLAQRLAAPAAVSVPSPEVP